MFGGGHGAGMIGMLVLAGGPVGWAVAAVPVGLLVIAARISHPWIYTFMVLVGIGPPAAVWWLVYTESERPEVTLGSSLPFLAVLLGRLIVLGWQVLRRR